MGGKCKRRNLCVRCGKSSYGKMCRQCGFKFRSENRAPDYRGSHRMVVCPGCGGPMHTGCALCWGCHSKSRTARPVAEKLGAVAPIPLETLPVGVEMALRSKAPELVTVACRTCGVQFVAVKDWHEIPSLHRGLREDKPDYFYCKDECYTSRPQSG